MEGHRKTGPVYFKLMIDLVLSSTPVSIRGIVRRLEKLTLKAFRGESVVTAVSLVRGAIAMMDNNDSTPADIYEIVMRMMKTSSSHEFNTYVTTLSTAKELGIKDVSLERTLLLLQNKYKELADDERWNVGDNDQAIFANSLECWNCGKGGHLARDCPEEIRRDAQGRDWTFGRGRGRGRAGRGGRGRGGRGRNSFRVPPNAGDANTRKRGTFIEYWCGKCGVWGSHLTKDHDDALTLTCVEITDDGNASTVTAPTTATSSDSGTSNNSATSQTTPFAGLLQDFW